MRSAGPIGVIVALAAAGALAACGSSSPPATTTTTAPPSAQSLPLTPALKVALLAAGAAVNHLPSSDFTGLRTGDTVYAYNPFDGRYWAGAQLVAKSTSTAAQVSVQDDGAFDLFVMVPGGSWKAYPDGLGTTPGATCAIKVPAPVRTAWHWSQSSNCGGPPTI